MANKAQNKKKKGSVSFFHKTKSLILSIAYKVQNFLKPYPPVIRYIGYAVCIAAGLVVAYFALQLFVLYFIMSTIFSSNTVPSHYRPKTLYDMEQEEFEQRMRWEEEEEMDRQNDLQRQQAYDDDCHY